jgi:sulfofructose kinase
MRPMKIVGVGLANLDLLGVLPAFPDKNSKNRVDQVSIQGGGPAATAIAAAAVLGARTALVGAIGDDDFGRAISRDLEELGVDVRGLVRVAGARSPFSFVAVDRGDASRTVFHAPGTAPPLDPATIDTDILDDADVLVIDARQPAAQLLAARRARGQATTVLLDAERLDDATRSLLPWTDVCVASAQLGRELGSDPLAALAALGPTTVVVTRGEEGSIGRRGDGPVVAQPAFLVDAVDTTGCGDVYHGAFAVGLARQLDLAGCMELASAAAALKCRALGGRAGLPSAGELDAFLASRRG